MMQKLRSSMILLVEPDDDVRPILRENLNNWGYEVILALDGADAIQRMKGRNELIDLILLNQTGQSINSVIDMGKQIRQSADFLSRVPIVVIAEQYGVELEGQNIQVGEDEYVTYLEDGQQLKNLLYRVCPIRPG
jgi:CheY-like chemotaxis protein